MKITILERNIDVVGEIWIDRSEEFDWIHVNISDQRD